MAQWGIIFAFKLGKYLYRTAYFASPEGSRFSSPGAFLFFEHPAEIEQSRHCAIRLRMGISKQLSIKI
jgi:hypothetical protein